MDNLNYGIIGNCKSSALISDKGNIEWFCLPEFDSSSVFAKILDKKKGGEFGIEVAGDYIIKQNYLHHTNILVTSYENSENAFELYDFMPRYKTEAGTYYFPPEIYRYIAVKKGNPKIKVNYSPSLNYADGDTKTSIHKDYIKSYSRKGPYESIYLYTDLVLEKVIAREEIEIHSTCFFIISYNQKITKLDCHKVYLEMQRTKVYWMNWMERNLKLKKYNEHLERSALTLKLLTYHKTGAILAAPTTSLPESLGHQRNWDYRFCWIRDASMTIKALTTINHYNAAGRFLNFIIDIVPKKDEKLQIMYGIHGEKNLEERILGHLEGYKGTKPVRIGNAAYIQKQNDIYGVLMDVIYQGFVLYKNTLDKIENLWTIVRSIVKTVEHNWQLPDKGIWEIRSEDKHFVFSKVLCWVAIDRGVKIAEYLSADNYVKIWSKVRDEIKEDILTKGWNKKIGAFPQAYDNEDMDAANLLMEMYGFIEPSDERYIRTVKKIKEELCEDGLMYRYKNQDDFGRPHSSFTVCTFWLIRSLYQIGEKDEARKIFEKLLSYSNHLGLFSEDIDFKTKELLGNFPQGYSHLALIDTAILLSEPEIDDAFDFYQPH